MFCATCGMQVQDGTRFCSNCGSLLTVPGGVIQRPRQRPNQSVPAELRGNRRPAKQQDPFQARIKELRLQIRQLKLNLKQVNINITNIRQGYGMSAELMPNHLLRAIDKGIEDVRLLKPLQQRQQLQQQIMQLEQELLGLEQQQTQWKAQQ